MSATGAGNPGGRARAGTQTKARAPPPAQRLAQPTPRAPLRPGRGPGPSAGLLPRAPHGRRRRYLGVSSRLAPESRNELSAGGLSRSSRGGGGSLNPGLQSPECLPRVTSSHSPRARPWSRALCRRSPQAERGPLPALHRRGGPSPVAPCLAGTQDGGARATHDPHADLSRSRMLAVRTGVPGAVGRGTGTGDVGSGGASSPPRGGAVYGPGVTWCLEFIRATRWDDDLEEVSGNSQQPPMRFYRERPGAAAGWECGNRASLSCTNITPSPKGPRGTSALRSVFRREAPPNSTVSLILRGTLRSSLRSLAQVE